MRITNSIVQRTALEGLQRNLSKIVDSQTTASTGLRVRAMSDDPNAASEILRADGSLRAIEQFKRNIASADGRLSAEENVLDQVTTTLERANELATAQGSSTADASTRLVAKSEVDQLLEFVRGLGNMQHEGDYLFGGVKSDVAPFSATPPSSATPPVGTRQAEISSGLMVKQNHNGDEVFLKTGVFAALEKLSTALGANDQAGIAATLSDLDQSHSQVQQLVGEVGARSAQLQITGSNLDALNGQLQIRKSGLQEADLDETFTELARRQTAYQSAMLATSRIMSMSLTDYLR
jgi:flagellar hook-associated protein 3 FlgL